ncbi:hypothetical protein QJS10_CPB04g01555 [Acorus calamus]|uniref:Mediator complex subunit 15 KIX domain-containing protein n=1 Tax=Acorus calamus TaxID=4465 RepID=A0AAV9EZB5_ACOCL|nr:hypothetical protein QJS10_CPB04g01555 [Acorus calamus]
MTEIRKIAVRLEEKIYAAATSQTDYLQRISLKMSTFETMNQKNHGGANPLPPTAGSGSQNPPDLGIPSANAEYPHMCSIDLEFSSVLVFEESS